MMKNVKKAPWRIVVGAISIAFIVYLWSSKDIARIYTTMPPEQIMPMIITTVLVSLLKVVLIAAAVILIKWIVEKMKKR